jgi:dTDP-4-dehydrorhamnose 3,5-epimerase
MEAFNTRDFLAIDVDDVFVQTSHSYSYQNVLRGLHYQLKHPQAKCVRVLAGELLDVVVDMRRSSKTFGKSMALHLNATQPQWLYVPKDFAHGFLTLSEHAQVEYMVSDYYFPNDEHVLMWNDPELRIPWNIDSPILSEKDRNGVRFAECAYF